MVIGYSFEELLNFIVSLEDEGDRLYTKLAEKFNKDKELKDFFLYLADQEKHHKIKFQEMLSKFVDDSKAKNIDLSDEYYNYINAFVAEVFKDNDQDLKFDDLKSSINFAMKKELDSINLYSNFKALLSEDQKEQIDLIIEEERKHFLSLFTLKNRS